MLNFLRKSALWLPLVAAGIWLGLRWSFGIATGYTMEDARTYGVFTNLFLILVLVLIGMTITQRDPAQGTFGRLKKVVRLPLIYSLLVAVSMLLYYKFAPEVEGKRSRDKAELEVYLSDDTRFNTLLETNPMLKGKTKEEVRVLAEQRITSMTSPTTMSALGFVMLVLSSVVYSLMAILLWKLLLRR